MAAVPVPVPVPGCLRAPSQLHSIRTPCAPVRRPDTQGALDSAGCGAAEDAK